MAALYKKGWSLQEIGDKFRVSKQRIAQIFKKRGIETRIQTVSKSFISAKKSARKILPKKDLVELYVKKEVKIKEILQIFNVSAEVLHRSLEFHKIPVRINPRHATILTYDLLKKMYLDEKLTANEIADRLGYKPVTVKDRLWKLKVKKYK